MNRVRNFCGVCYEEHAPDLVRYFKEYTERGIIRAWYIVQHKPEQEEKQIHFHFLVEFYNAKTLTSLDKATGLRSGLTEVCTDVRSYACYMLHKYELDKKRYYLQNVESNDKERFSILVNSKNSNDCCQDKLVFKKFSDLCCNNDLPFYSILNILCSDKDIEVRTIRKNAYLFKVFYESCKYENSRKGDK